MLKEAWKDCLKDEHYIKLKGKVFMRSKQLLSSKQIVLEFVVPKAMDFYTVILEYRNRSEMKTFAASGYDVYINKSDHPVAYEVLDDILLRFLGSYLPA